MLSWKVIPQRRQDGLRSFETLYLSAAEAPTENHRVVAQRGFLSLVEYSFGVRAGISYSIDIFMKR